MSDVLTAVSAGINKDLLNAEINEIKLERFCELLRGRVWIREKNVGIMGGGGGIVSQAPGLDQSSEKGEGNQGKSPGEVRHFKFWRTEGKWNTGAEEEGPEKDGDKQGGFLIGLAYLFHCLSRTLILCQ